MHLELTHDNFPLPPVFINPGISASQSGETGRRTQTRNMPTEAPDISMDAQANRLRIDNVIAEDLLALGVSIELLREIEAVNATGTQNTRVYIGLDHPKVEIVKFFAALEVLTNQRCCPDCGVVQLENNRIDSCLNCGEVFKTIQYLDPMKAIAQRNFLDMDGIEFEHEVARLFTLRGYHMQVTQASRDGGIDIVGSAPGIGGQKVAVQCKRYATTTVGIADIQRFWGIISASEYATGFFVTTSTFSGDSWQFAKDKQRLVLIDGRELQKWKSI